MKTLLIINPYSRGGKSAATAQKLIRHLNERNYLFDAVEVQHFEDAYNLSQQANRSGIENIIAVGGDGTINKVLNGFYDDCGNKISESRFGVVHTGTSPDFCRSYNIPTDVQLAADTIIRQNIKYIPVGMIRLRTRQDNSDQNTFYFACCANIGIGASLARKANSGIRSYLGDFMGTLVSFRRILVSCRGTDYKVMIDKRETELKNLINISVGITPYIASGLKVTRDPSVSSDQFYILKVSEVKVRYIPGLLKLLYSGDRFTDSPLLSLQYAARIEILNNLIHSEVEFDGDPAGFLPCSVEIAKNRLPVFTN